MKWNTNPTTWLGTRSWRRPTAFAGALRWPCLNFLWSVARAWEPLPGGSSPWARIGMCCAKTHSATSGSCWKRLRSILRWGSSLTRWATKKKMPLRAVCLTRTTPARSCNCSPLAYCNSMWMAHPSWELTDKHWRLLPSRMCPTWHVYLPATSRTPARATPKALLRPPTRFATWAIPADPWCSTPNATPACVPSF